MNRPLHKPFEKKKEDFSSKFWAEAEKNKSIEKSEEQVIFHLSDKEARRCRYELTDQTQRMAECIVHEYHGVRLHPPHEWDLKNGIVYYKGERWFPNIKENLTRFEEKT